MEITIIEQYDLTQWYERVMLQTVGLLYVLICVLI